MQLLHSNCVQVHTFEHKTSRKITKISQKDILVIISTKYTRHMMTYIPEFHLFHENRALQFSPEKKNKSTQKSTMPQSINTNKKHQNILSYE